MNVVHSWISPKTRDEKWKNEILMGIVHFVSCIYVLPVIPSQLRAAGYNPSGCIAVISLCCCFGSIFSSILTDLPFVVAPLTSISIYLSASLQENRMSFDQGRMIVTLSGFGLLLIGLHKPLQYFIASIIPQCIQSSTAVGIGLITALAGLIDIKLVIPGRYTLLTMGSITPIICVTLASVLVIGLAMYYHIPGPFVVGLLFGSIVYWIYDNSFPSEIVASPIFCLSSLPWSHVSWSVINMVMNLLLLYVLTLNGLSQSLSDLAHLTTPDRRIPKGHWLLVVCGISTIISGYLGGPPILISPESAAAIKSGASTGLGVFLCGIFFGLGLFFAPLITSIPTSGTSPLLILVGMLLFHNMEGIAWSDSKQAISAFWVVLMIPFTCSIFTGIGFGLLFYLSFYIFTGEWISSAVYLWNQMPYLSFNSPLAALMIPSSIDGTNSLYEELELGCLSEHCTSADSETMNPLFDDNHIKEDSISVMGASSPFIHRNDRVLHNMENGVIFQDQTSYQESEKWSNSIISAQKMISNSVMPLKRNDDDKPKYSTLRRPRSQSMNPELITDNLVRKTNSGLFETPMKRRNSSSEKTRIVAEMDMKLAPVKFPLSVR